MSAWSCIIDQTLSRGFQSVYNVGGSIIIFYGKKLYLYMLEFGCAHNW